MKFTRLRLLGFKSFVEPTEFLIEPGLTGVIGPNGCGKSNLVEALRWVMGENSYKNMRASGMDDVIFQGSLNRPARNTAEVSLTIDNSDRTAPAALNDSDHIDITRRIEREAGSVYRINGRDVRARDVTLLFADASSGAHSPAIVGQGKIGELIAAKPVDRRALLEEAAGISGLRGRRHEAELRLRAAEQNLARLDDVIREIEQQFDALKRQARQASRYRNLSGEIRKAEATVLHLRWQAASVAVTEASEQLKEAVELATVCAEAQSASARLQAEAAIEVPALRDSATRAAAALQRIKLAAEQIDQEDRRVRSRLAELEQRLTQLSSDIAREQTMIGENAEAMERLNSEERELNSANAAMADSQTAAAEKRNLTEAALSASEAELATLTQKHATLAARRRQAEKSLADSIARTERLLNEQKSSAADLESTGAADLATATAAARAAVEQAESERDTRDAAIAGVEQASAAARSNAGKTREHLTEAQRAHDRIETEAATLAAILASDSDGRTPVVDSISVDDGYETALGAAFGDDLDAPVDADALAHWHEVSATDEQSLPDGVTPLAQFVRTPAVLHRRIAQTGLVAREDGLRIQADLKPGQRIVSREGDLWRWDGYIAAADAPRSAAQKLERRNRLAALTAELASAKAHVDALRAEHEAAEATVREAAEAERAAREALRVARKLVDDRRQSLTNAEREEGRVATRRASLEERLSRVARDISESETATESARAELAETGELESVTEELQAQRQKVEADRAAVAEARAAVEGMAREANIRNSRLVAIANERRSWTQRAENAEKQIAALTQRQAEAAAEREGLVEEPARIEERRVAILSEIATAETAQAAASDKLAVAEKHLAEADKTAREALEQLSLAREKRGRAEERVTAAQQRLQEAADRIQEALDCAPGEAFGIAELKVDAPLPKLEEVEARLERYKQERERLGGVNLRADEEAQEISSRRDGLSAEREDLIQAIQRLRQGIGSLNREGRERLLAAFDTVNGHFKRLFTHLFGGGQAELQLTESDDPLQAGLEIIARPPGKKPQTMTLLSGGEQALTAMSLIFAVFLTNPAPICVLDEVDAPLDDANVVRFCNLLEEMARSTDTRFITITHNPITMERMNRLFGVTMAERGVSQLVSVNLETAEQFLEAS